MASIFRCNLSFCETPFLALREIDTKGATLALGKARKRPQKGIWFKGLKLCCERSSYDVEAFFSCMNEISGVHFDKGSSHTSKCSPSLFSFAALYLTLNLNLLTLNQNQLFSEYSWNIPASDVTVCRQGWSGIAAELAELALVNQVDDVTTDQLMTTPYIQTKVQNQIIFKS